MKKMRLEILSMAVLAILFALITRTQLQAQSSMSSASPAKVYDQLLSMIEHEMVPLAEAMPADKYNFAPTNGNFEGVRTFAEQVSHVTQANYSFFGAAASMQHPNMPKTDAAQGKEQLVQALKDSFAFAHQAIAKLTAENAFEVVKPVDRINTRAGIVSFALIHMNDHFGQMVEYLRMNGKVPPSSMPRPR